MSQIGLFVAGVVVFAITVGGAVMAGPLLIIRHQATADALDVVAAREAVEAAIVPSPGRID